MHRTKWHRIVVGAAGMAFASAAHAQNAPDGPPLQGPPVVQPSSASALPEQTAADQSAPNQIAAPAPSVFQRYDDLSLKGWDIPFPKIADTIIGDKGGIRSKLADLGIGFLGFNTTTYQYDLSQTDKGYHGPQLYNGQRLTRTNGIISVFISVDLDQYGIPGGQIQSTWGYFNNSFPRLDGPRSLRNTRLAYFQSLFKGKVEVKFGLLDNASEYFGTNVGGNLAVGNLGPQATIPFEVGLAYLGFAAPGINIKTKLGGHFYNKYGLQRSLPPGGANAEIAYNPHGFSLHVPGTGLLQIEELGWNRPSAPGVKATWIRGGGLYNTTNFTRFRDGRGVDNWAAFLSGDRQLTQIDRTKPYRGLYAGAAVYYAPPQQNFYSQYYEARIYGLGLIKSRPFDLASVVASVIVNSKDGLAARTTPDVGNYGETMSLVASYGVHVTSGFYIQPGLGIVHHPIYSPRFGTAINGYLTATTLF